MVTGAGQGIGKASALALAAAGAHVVVADIAAPKAAEDGGSDHVPTTAGGCRAGGFGDLRDIDRMVRQTLDAFGQIDILLNNAGVTRRADIMDLTEEDWDRIHRVNAKGVFFCLQRVAREMIPRRSGRIINVASIAGKGYEGTSNAAYAASKGAVISLTKTAAQQLGKHNINVNSVCPGVTRTALSDANLQIRAQQAGVTVEEMELVAPRSSRCNGRTIRRISPRWWSSWHRPRAQHNRPVVQRGRRPDPGLAPSCTEYINQEVSQ